MKRNSTSAGRVTVPIHVRSLQRKFPLNVPALEVFAQRALRECARIQRGRSKPRADLDEILILLISDRRMANLHRRFLNESGPTDVITFQHGEIFISVPTARRHARNFGTSLLHEIQLYIVHGLLHLHGFDDRTAAQQRQIRAAEATVLRRTAV